MRHIHTALRPEQLVDFVIYANGKIANLRHNKFITLEDAEKRLEIMKNREGVDYSIVQTNVKVMIYYYDTKTIP